MYGILLATDANGMVMWYVIAGLIYANLAFLFLLDRKLAWIRSQLIGSKKEGSTKWFLGLWFLGSEIDTPAIGYPLPPFPAFPPSLLQPPSLSPPPGTPSESAAFAKGTSTEMKNYKRGPPWVPQAITRPL
jgi:hypothetical protein